jgi:hypothetical protein
MRRAAYGLLLGVALAACSEAPDQDRRDAGATRHDAAVLGSDAAPRSQVDASDHAQSPDASEQDAGGQDAGERDAGEQDGGVPRRILPVMSAFPNALAHDGSIQVDVDTVLALPWTSGVSIKGRWYTSGGAGTDIEHTPGSFTWQMADNARAAAQQHQKLWMFRVATGSAYAPVWLAGDRSQADVHPLDATPGIPIPRRQFLRVGGAGYTNPGQPRPLYWIPLPWDPDTGSVDIPWNQHVVAMHQAAGDRYDGDPALFAWQYTGLGTVAEMNQVDNKSQDNATWVVTPDGKTETTWWDPEYVPDTVSMAAADLDARQVGLAGGGRGTVASFVYLFFKAHVYCFTRIHEHWQHTPLAISMDEPVAGPGESDGVRANLVRWIQAAYPPRAWPYLQNNFLQANVPTAFAPRSYMPQLTAAGFVTGYQPSGPFSGYTSWPATSPHWKAEWSAVVAYVTGDAVSFHGNAYRALTGNTGQKPTSEPALWADANLPFALDPADGTPDARSYVRAARADCALHGYFEPFAADVLAGSWDAAIRGFAN